MCLYILSALSNKHIKCLAINVVIFISGPFVRLKVCCICIFYTIHLRNQMPSSKISYILHIIIVKIDLRLPIDNKHGVMDYVAKMSHFEISYQLDILQNLA